MRPGWAAAASGAASRLPVRVPRNLRRFVADLRLAASSRRDRAGPARSGSNLHQWRERVDYDLFLD